MKPLRTVAMAGGIAALWACAPTPQAPPPAPPAQPRPSAPLPPPPPPPPRVDWQDMPLTPGNWVYSRQSGASQAAFGPPASEASFIVRCDPARRQIVLSREGTTTGNSMTVRSSTGARSLPVTVRREPLAYFSSTLPATDRFLDGIVFSRGRFTVEAAGAPMLVIPSWPEPARVIEDCRG